MAFLKSRRQACGELFTLRLSTCNLILIAFHLLDACLQPYPDCLSDALGSKFCLSFCFPHSMAESLPFNAYTGNGVQQQFSILSL